MHNNMSVCWVFSALTQLQFNTLSFFLDGECAICSTRPAPRQDQEIQSSCHNGKYCHSLNSPSQLCACGCDLTVLAGCDLTVLAGYDLNSLPSRCISATTGK